MSGEASVTYSSTRGGQKNLDFRSVVMTGLAHDKGLFVPDSYPSVSAEELAAWKSLSYKDLSVQVIRKFEGRPGPSGETCRHSGTIVRCISLAGGDPDC